MKTIGIISVLLAACLFPAAVVSQTLVWEGTWSSSTPYTAGQVVSYLGGTYICITGNTNVPPPTSTVDWTALAQSGATVSVGTTVTGAPLTNAAVTNVGTAKNAVLNFTIPQGYISGGGGGIPWPSNAGLAAYSGSSSWRAPTYSDVTALWAGGTCSGYLSSNGTCSTTLGFLPINNPTFTGNLSGPTASITSLTTAGVVTNTASGVLGTVTGTSGYYALWNSLGNLGNGHLSDASGTITSTEPIAGTSAAFSGAFSSDNGAVSTDGSGSLTAKIINGVVNAASPAFSGSDACAKIRAANLFALANGIPNVDIRGFSGTQVCTSGTDIWGDLASSNANLNLVDWFGSVRIETTTPFTITNPGLTIIGAGAPNTWIEYTGSTVAAAVVSIGSATPTSVYIQNVRLSGLLLFGDTANVTDGLFLTGVHHSIFSDILTWGVTGCGIHTEFAVTNTFIAPRTSGLDASQFGISTGHSTPTNGLCLGQIDGSHKTTDSTFVDAAAEGATGVGWWISGADGMVFDAGTSENNGGDGVQIDNGNVGNEFIGIDLEGNTGTDNLLDNGQQTEFYGPVFDSKPVELGATSTGFYMHGGNLTASVNVDAGAANYAWNYGQNHVYDYLANGNVAIPSTVSGYTGSASSNVVLSGSPTGTGNATWGHFIASGTPTIACGTGAGTSPTVCSIAGNDEAGQISVTTGTSPANAAIIATVTLHNACPTSVYAVVRGSNAAAASLSGTSHEYPDGFTASTWTLTSNTTGLAASTAYTWSYIARCN